MDYVGTYKLDARPDRIDLRDREYLPPLKSLEPVFPSSETVQNYFPLYIEHKMVLDQGAEGACTGFGLAAMVNYLLWKREIVEKRAEEVESPSAPDKVSMRMLYHLARFYDEWPGEDYEGSSCRGAVKAWHRHGVCSEEKWPYREENGKVRFIAPLEGWDKDAAKRPMGVYYRINKDSIEDMQAAILEVGAIYVSARVHKGWNISGTRGSVSHNNLPVLSWQKGMENTGGHAFALVGYNGKGFIIQNSWGVAWGLQGFAVISYEDWQANGTDAWVCVLGVPQGDKVPSHYITAALPQHKKSYTQRMGAALKKVSHEYQDRSVQRWSTSEAYNHTLVMGNDGRVINRLVTNEKEEDTVDDLVFRKPKEFFKQGGPQRLAIYAHGGLNAEEGSIERIQTMAPYFMANGVYPLFFTWKTGVLDSMLNILEDSAARIFHRVEGFDDLLEDAKRKALDVLDRTIEIACENLGIKAIWSQMKQNGAEAAKSGDNDRGAFLATAALRKLQEIYPDLEIHMVGHSAGSILLGHMLDDFPRNNLQVKTLSLYAPACSLDFANRYIRRAVEKDVLSKEDLNIYALSSQREIDDNVGPYQKSLLYLVSRALEKSHKTPLLGMVDALDHEKSADRWSKKTISGLKKWQDFFSLESENLFLVKKEQVVTARHWEGGHPLDLALIDSAHGSFDNDVDIVDETLRRITDQVELEHKVENLRF